MHLQASSDSSHVRTCTVKLWPFVREVHFSTAALPSYPNSHIISKNYPFIRLGNHVTIEGKNKMIIANTKVLITKGSTP